MVLMDEVKIVIAQTCEISKLCCNNGLKENSNRYLNSDARLVLGAVIVLYKKDNS